MFFSYRYWTTYFGMQIAPRKSILVPTAEHDRVLYLRLFQPFFKQPAAIAFNTPEERELIERVTGNPSLPGEVVGTGIVQPPEVPVAEVAPRLDLLGDYFVYVGRIEPEKGCAVMIDHFLRWQRETRATATLALFGRSTMTFSENAHVRLMGVVPDGEKLAAIARARALVMPSRHESLSMVVLESWMMQRPVLVNGDCEVLRGQVLRADGGLYYRRYEEFAAAMDLLLHEPALADRLGRQGQAYFEANYAWPRIMEKYERLLARAAAGNRRVLKLAFVIQRYGLEVNGGAELHCRWLAERMALRHQVEVFATRALDYLEWKNHYPKGTEVVNGIPVHRSTVKRTRNARVFASLSNVCFHETHTREEEIAWVRENGPFSPELVLAVKAARSRFDRILFYCYRYYHSFHGVPAVADRAILVPTAEEDPGDPPRGDEAALPRTARARVPDARGAGARRGRERQRLRSQHRDRQRHQPAPGRIPRSTSARSTGSSGLSCCTSAASTATRARSRCSPTSRSSSRRRTPTSTSCWRGSRSSRSRSTRASATSASSASRRRSRRCGSAGCS